MKHKGRRVIWQAQQLTAPRIPLRWYQRTDVRAVALVITAALVIILLAVWTA